MTEPYSINLLDPWRAKAACRGMDANWFHPVRGGSVDKQRKVCDSCPVKVECLRYALDNNIWIGIYGGTTEKDRRRLKRGLGMMKTLTKRCDHCREVFETKDNGPGNQQRYCSRRCSQRASYERRRLSA